jgi:hypothetical protein
VREEIDFSSIDPGVELERDSEFVKSIRDSFSALFGVLQRDDEAVEGGFFAETHFLWNE